MASVAQKLLTWRPGPYLRSSGYLLFWMMLRALALGSMVIVLSRLFGASDYGKFITAAAIASFFVPFAGLGLSGILLRDGARNPIFMDDLLASALRTWAWSTMACMTFGSVVGALILTDGIPLLPAMALIAAEITSTSLVELLGRAEQARHHVARFGALTAGLPVARIVALIVYWAAGQKTLSGWMWAYAGAGLLYAGVAYAWLKPRVGNHGHADVPQLKIREGLSFGAAALSMRVQAEFNKPFLARLGFDQAAHMGVAQRAVDFVSLPLMALQDALWPRLYAVERSRQSFRMLTFSLVCLALAAGAVIWVAAPLLPRFLGADFSPATDALRMLALLPALQCYRNICNFRTMAAEQTWIVGCSFTAGAVTGVLGVAILVPSMGVPGAIVAAYSTEIVVIGIQLVASHTCLPMVQPALPKDSR